MKPEDSSRIPSQVISQSYLAAAEPSWARRIDAWQLMGVINLSALLTPKLYLSDVHLGDNSHVFNSYLGINDSQLFEHIIELTRIGIVVPLLRDRTIRPHKDNADFKIHNFQDVYSGWNQLDDDAAFINQVKTDSRARFFEALDEKIDRHVIRRYSYEKVKEDFMHRVRGAANSERETWFGSAIDELSIEERRTYDAILNQSWFSLSDIYSYLQTLDKPDTGLSALYAHGLINESCYSTEVDCNLTGFDTEQAFIEERVWRPDPVSSLAEEKNVKEVIVERSDASFEAPPLSLLASMTPSQIADIRKSGQSYFNFALHSSRVGQDFSDDDFQRQYIYYARSYWDSICDYIADNIGAAMRPRKMVLYFDRLPGPLSKLSQEMFRFSISLGSAAIMGGEAGPINSTIKRLAQFVFLTERDEMKQLRKMLPFGVWSRKPPAGS